MGSLLTRFQGEEFSDDSSVYETNQGEIFADSCDFNQGINMTPAITNNKNLKTDTLQNKKPYAFKSRQNIKLTVEIAQGIENALNFYEKVSLVFLLYEYEDVALQNLLTEETLKDHNLLRKSNLLSEWARSEHTTLNWPEQLLEALCIIQNYSELHKLGYEIEDLKVRFLPSLISTSLYVCPVRKALYHICENFTVDKTKQFIKLLHDDFKEKNIPFKKFNENYLEMYFLYCFSMKYIKYNNLSNVIKLLKVMKLENVCDSLINITNKRRTCEIPRMEQNEENFMKVTDDMPVEFHLNEKMKNLNFESNGSQKNCSQNSVIGDNSLVNLMPGSSEERYSIDPQNMGICLIINQEIFHQEEHSSCVPLLPFEKLHKREGTHLDRDKLREIFEALGFKVVIENNLKHNEIEDSIRAAIEQFSAKDSCFFLCVLSHGITGYIYGANSVLVNIGEIEETMLDSKYKNLYGKPKVLIVQSCQGMPLQEVMYQDQHITTDGGHLHFKPNKQPCNAIEKSLNIPEKTDLLVCSSTIPGYASVRNEKEGSWYIQELCRVLKEESGRKHMLDILTTVNNHVSSKRWVREELGKMFCMVPELKSSLRKALYLPAILQNENSSTTEPPIRDFQTI